MSLESEQAAESLSPLVRAISGHRFAADMKPEHLKRLFEAAMFREFAPDETIFREGEPANRFYLVCQGKIAVESRSGGEPAALIQIVGEGEVLGWSWLFPPHYWRFSARAVTHTSAIFFYGTRLRDECEEDPAFGYELMARVAVVVIKRLQIVRAQMLQMQQESAGGPSI